MADIEFTLNNKLMPGTSEMLYLNDADADVNFTFMVDGIITRIPAKKANLMVLSPVFKAMFSGNTRQQRDVTVDATIDAFKEFLQFFHSADVKLTIGNMKEVTRLAKDYDIFAHVDSCLEKFRTELTFENVCWAYQLSIFFGNHRMKKSCENYISVFTEEILASDAFHHCDKDVLKNILQLNSIACTNLVLYQACFEWAQCACQRVGINENHEENLLQQLDDCVRTEDSNDVEHMDLCAIRKIKLNDLKKCVYDRRSPFDRIINIKRSNPFSEGDKLRIMDDDSPWFSTFSYIEFEAPSPDARSLSRNNQVLFSTSHPVLLRDIELKSFHCKTKRNDHDYYDLELLVKVFEYSNLSFEENEYNRLTMVFQESVKIRINTNPPENASISPCISPCIFINPRKMYKFTWQVMNKGK